MAETYSEDLDERVKYRKEVLDSQFISLGGWGVGAGRKRTQEDCSFWIFYLRTVFFFFFAFFLSGAKLEKCPEVKCPENMQKQDHVLAVFFPLIAVIQSPLNKGNTVIGRTLPHKS